MNITRKDLYEILSAIIPMYFTLAIAYISVKVCKLFTPDHGAGINRFLRVFAIPLLSFKLISSNNLYAINYKLFAADCLQKISFLILLLLWKKFSKKSSLEWMITFFSLSSLPNTMIIGLPIARAMYGAESVSLMVQTLVFQGVIWINVLLFLLEYREAKVSVSQKFPGHGGGADQPVKPFEGMTDVYSVKSSVSRETSLEMADLDGDYDDVLAERTTASRDCSEFEEGMEDLMGKKDQIHMFVWESGTASCCSVTNESFEQKEAHAGNPAHFDTWKPAKIQSDTSSTGNPEKGKDEAQLTKLVFHMVCKKITRNPNTYSSLFGVVWSLLSFKYHMKMPTVLSKCLMMFSDTALALAMFSLGTFMAAQPNVVACSRWEALLAMVARFLVSPVVMTATSKLVGLTGVALRTAIIQAAFPQAILSFVFAKEYNVNPNVLSTSVALGMLIALPVIFLYYLVLGSIFP